MKETNKGRGSGSMRSIYKMGRSWCLGLMTGGVYDYRDGAGEIAEGVINK